MIIRRPKMREERTHPMAPHSRRVELSRQCSTGGAQSRILESTVPLGLQIRTTSLQIQQSGISITIETASADFSEQRARRRRSLLHHCFHSSKGPIASTISGEKG